MIIGSVIQSAERLQKKREDNDENNTDNSKWFVLIESRLLKFVILR